MKKLALLAVLILLLVFTVRVSLAQTTKPSPFQVRKDRLEGKREGLKERAGEKKIDLKAKKENLKEKRGENIAKFLQKMAARLEAMVTRLETLIARIESRIAKIEAQSQDSDLSSVKADLAEAKGILSSTKDKITDLKGLEATLTDSLSPKEDFEGLRSKVDAIKKDLKEVHRLLVHVIGDIKGLRVGDTKNETE